MMKFGNKVVVLGAGGWMGREVIARLSEQKYQVTAVVKRASRNRDLALFPQVKVREVQDWSLEKVQGYLAGQEIVINLLTDQSVSHEACHDEALRELQAGLVLVAEEQAIARWIQLSHLGAGTQADSPWAQLCGLLDEMVIASRSMLVTILRAGLLIGQGDDTTTLYQAQLQRSKLMLMPNAERQVQPLWVRDFARALAGAIKQPASYGKIWELAGDEDMSLQDLASWVAQFQGVQNPTLLPMCQMNAKFMALLGPLAPFRVTTAYQNKRMANDQITDQAFADLTGFKPRQIEAVLSDYISQMKTRQRYDFLRRNAGRKTTTSA
ncbi:NAD(P)H-binding protein [Thiomicrospira sp. ALE5]|uniref:NAD(P)H-binding protein n=1 Tax=Thiomicrospira sp. ALE5 TaxID=748650 RepID=UPI0008F0E58E|nr:NAD(P)H-binding protein [Thiomicrospira sp. ALE5]SFR64189.1 NADH dehydrogenase [Thiomicrospira sp. ALE5]